MVKQILLICCILILIGFHRCKGQSYSQIKRNALSLELGKSGLALGLYYDHLIKKFPLGFRIGAAGHPGRYLSAYTLGGGTYYLFGKPGNSIELGIDLMHLSVDAISDDQKSLTLFYPSYTGNSYYASLNIGYRAYHKRSVFRIGVSPGLIKTRVLPGAYISVGSVF